MSSGVAKGIGIAREYYEHRKEQKQTDTSPAESQPVIAPVEAGDDQYGKLDVDDKDDDEEAWVIDDAQDEEPKDVKPTIQEAKNVKQLLEAFQRLHPQPAQPIRTANLPLPVILPQRRPRHRDRGFVRAYSPILQEQGIDQSAFFDFLDGFERAIRVSISNVNRSVPN